MKPEVETLFHAVADLAPEEREQEFARRNITAELRAEVEALLQFDSARNASLTAFVASSAQTAMDASALPAGARCGRYRLARILGRGGMGSVYLAERADGEVSHLVAVKLLNH